jgi:hypothetical protein
MRAIAEGEVSPSVTRVSYGYETQFSFSTKQGDSLLDRVKSKALTTYLTGRREQYDLAVGDPATFIDSGATLSHHHAV